MKTLFDTAVQEEFKTRINKLDEHSKAGWGKMTVSQMLKHCIQWEEMILGKKVYRQSFIGKLFGKGALKGMLKDETPVKKNLPTVPSFKIKESSEVEPDKRKWIALISGHATVKHDEIVHPFFGKMTEEQIGQMAYKHIDHHLRQFGV